MEKKDGERGGEYIWGSLSTKIGLTTKNGEIYGQNWMGGRSTTSWEVGGGEEEEEQMGNGLGKVGRCPF